MVFISRRRVPRKKNLMDFESRQASSHRLPSRSSLCTLTWPQVSTPRGFGGIGGSNKAPLACAFKVFYSSREDDDGSFDVIQASHVYNSVVFSGAPPSLSAQRSSPPRILSSPYCFPFSSHPV